MSGVLLILPIFSIIALGKLLSHVLVTDEGFWSGLNRLSYIVLFPSFLFFKISMIDFGNVPLANYTYALLGGFFAALFYSFIVGGIICKNRGAVSSVVQGSARHNTFLALAVAVQLLGETGAIIGILSTIILVPLSNILVVLGMIIYVGNLRAGFLGGMHHIALEMCRNPIIVSIVIGGMVNFLGWGGDLYFHKLAELLGAASLPLILLCVGAGLKFSGVSQHVLACCSAVFGKMFIFPLVTYSLAIMFGLSDDMILVAMLFAMAPTSAASYIVAKQMGGDGELMAVIVSVQTALAVVMYPLILVFLVT